MESEVQEAKDWAVISGEALTEIKEALFLPMDIVNKARLFDEQLKKEEKLNGVLIICYLSDQVWKMEKTWKQMRLLVGNLISEGSVQQGTQT